MYALLNGDAIAEIIYAPRAVTIADVRYPRTIFTQWQAEDLAALGIVPAIPPAPVNTRWERQTGTDWRFVDDAGGRRAVGVAVTVPRALDDIRDDLHAAVASHATQRINAMADERDQRALLAAGTQAILAHGPDPAQWPPELQQQFAASGALWSEVERLRAVEAAKTAQIEDADTLAQLQAIDVLGGWNV